MTVYQPRLVKRVRRTKAEIAALRDAIRAIVRADPPMAGRHVFYLAVNHGLVPKTERGEDRVGEAINWLRRHGEIGWPDVIDTSRSVALAAGFASVGAALDAWAKYYRRDFWAGRQDRPAIYIEKDALAGLISPITEKYGVPLMSARGDASNGFLYECTQYLTDASTVYAFSDLDGPGEGSIIKAMRRKFPKYWNCHARIERVALTPAQVREHKLPKRPPKKGDKRKYAVDLDALPKAELQRLVKDCILRHVDASEWQAHLEHEAADQERLAELATRYGATP